MKQVLKIPISVFTLVFASVFQANCDDYFSVNATTSTTPSPSSSTVYPRNFSTTTISYITTTTTVEPVTTTTTGRGNAIAARLYTSSSSSSAEDQLTPLLLSNGPTTCVTCPPTVCTLSKVSYMRKAIHHNWRVNGLPDYLTYLEKFNAPFELQSEVRFNLTPPNDGQWTFMFYRSGISLPFPSQFGHPIQSGSGLDLRVTYRYKTETRAPPRLAFDLWLSAHVEDEYVTLPSQISSIPTLQPLPPSLSPGNSEDGWTWKYLFVWTDIQSKLVTLMESAGLESQTVEFKFVINSYQGGDVYSADAECGSWNGEEGGQHVINGNKKRHHNHNGRSNHLELSPQNNATWPPFLSQMYALMKDDKYTDLTVKSGDEEYQIHRVIAAYSSPVLATLIYNLTYKKSESLLDFGEDIGSDVVEELIRYMYTGRVEDIEEIADRLMVAATTYEFPALKRQCESVLIKQVKTENAFSMYALGAEVGSMRLKRRAFNIMKENKSKIVAQSEEFRKLSVHHPDVMYELFLS